MSTASDPQQDPAGPSPRPEDEVRTQRSVQPLPPPVKPARSALSVRDMLIALAVLVPIVLVMAGSVRSCAFSPGGPTVSSGAIPVIDAPARLREFAPRVPFALRVPAVPAGWRANSTDRGVIEGGGRAVRVGWITPDGRYLRIVQSDASEEALVATEAGGPVAGRGTADAAGQRWVVYGRAGAEPFWVTEVPGAPTVRLLITGSGTEDEFRALATATLTGGRLPTGSAPAN